MRLRGVTVSVPLVSVGYPPFGRLTDAACNLCMRMRGAPPPPRLPRPARAKGEPRRHLLLPVDGSTDRRGGLDADTLQRVNRTAALYARLVGAAC